MRSGILRSVERASVLARRLADLAPLTAEEAAFVERIENGPSRTLQPSVRLLAESGLDSTPLLVVSGWACRNVDLSDGRRQIVELLGPGDFIGLTPLSRSGVAANITPITKLRVASALDLRLLLQERRRYPGLVASLDRVAAEGEASLIAQIARAGRMTAYERLAHFLLEINHRLSGRGLSDAGLFALPVTQEILADTLGLSTVHTNRTLQQMRREGVIKFAQGQMRLLNIPALTAASGFRAFPSDAPRSPSAN